MSKLSDFLLNLPKAELHLHIEGSLEAELAFRLSKKNKIAIPGAETEDELRSLYKFDDLQSFLNLYYSCMAVLINEQDFYDLAMAYLTKVSREGVVHAECFFDPQAHTKRGVKYDTVIKGLHRAGVDAKKEFGISVLWIASFLRDDPVADGSKHCAEATLDAILKPHVRNMVVGVGLDSAEAPFPPLLFEKIYLRAAKAGLQVTAHAGEEGPWTNVRDVVETLNTRRVDHGQRVLENDEYTEVCKRKGIVFTLCPLSTLALGGVKRLSDHPIAAMLRRGLNVTINSDDPAYFGGYCGTNFIRVHEEVKLTVAELVQCARNSLSGTFAKPEERWALIQKLNVYLEQNKQLLAEFAAAGI